MSNETTRRQFLRAAGGVTFLALAPVGSGLFAALRGAGSGARLPLFTALPYIQPGAGSLLVEGQESMVIAWQTQARDAEFELSFGAGPGLGRRAQISRSHRWSGEDGDSGSRFNYSAALGGLSLGRKYLYRASCNGQVILEGYFTTRKPRGQSVRFAAFGDNSFGDISDRAIAFQAYRARPDFVMNTGDNVYDGGLDNEYARYFFPVYNADAAGPRLGAPLLRSVPFYTVLANHDVHRRDAQKNPVADFGAEPDALAYYTNMHLPLNGPAPAHATPAIGPPGRLGIFRAAAGERFPRMANYSYDYGDCHFLCLDSNIYTDPTDPALQAWIEADLGASDAPWKFVAYHHPAFNVGHEHYAEQHMRVLCPLFEKHGVSFVLHGHEHNYQRTRPLRFEPRDLSRAGQVNSGDRRVPGDFLVDRAFDGQAHTCPEGIIYVTTGAGGKALYDADQNEAPASWLHPEDARADYVARMVSDRHSLTIFDVEPRAVSMAQIDESGQVIERIRVTRA